MPITIMRWPTRPSAAPVLNRKVSVSFIVHEFRGATLTPEDGETASYYVDVKWKGPKTTSPFTMRKSLKRGRTALKLSGDFILWDEEFMNECVLVQSMKGNGQQREVSFQSWEVHFVLRKVIGAAVEKPVTFGTVVVDLASFVGLSEIAKRTELFNVSKGEGGLETVGSLMVTLHMEDVNDDVESMESQPTRAYSVGSVVECTLAGSPSPKNFSKGKNKSFQLLDTEYEEPLEKIDVTTKSPREKEKTTPRPPAGRLALGNFLSRGRSSSVKENSSYFNQKRLLDALDLSVPSSFAGDETEDENCDDDDSLRYGRMVGVNLAVQNALPIPTLIPISGHRDSLDDSSTSSTSPGNLMLPMETSSSSDDENSTSSLAPLSPHPSTHQQQQTQQSRRFFGMSLSFGGSTKPLLPESLVTGNNLQTQGDQESLSDSEDGPDVRPGIGAGLALKIPGGGGGWAIMGKRKLGNRSPKMMEEPLLNKAYGEDGGDEIDWDRRKAVEAEAEHPLHLQKLSRKANSESIDDLVNSVFGEAFSVGKWETKEVVSREGAVTLKTDVFFAGMDQCHERAAGEGACASLVVLVAEWFLSHPCSMPTKAEFDDIIREGSAEWRRLCEVDTYKLRFADKHFDLETVVESRNGTLQMVSERSFVGFFRPSVKGDEKDISESLCFLDDAMSFDSIWQEVSNSGPGVYIISWNDHFFVLVVEDSRCYVVDTLGERLYEGCKQAYILRFDENTCLTRVKKPSTATTSEMAMAAFETTASSLNSRLSPSTSPVSCDTAIQSKVHQVDVQEFKETVTSTSEVEEPARDLCTESAEEFEEDMSPMKMCGHFIKDFFAAVPLGELEKDIAKGLMGQIPLHRRLQVEFHYSQLGSVKK